VQARLLQAQRDAPDEIHDFCAISGASGGVPRLECLGDSDTVTCIHSCRHGRQSVSFRRLLLLGGISGQLHGCECVSHLDLILERRQLIEVTDNFLRIIDFSKAFRSGNDVSNYIVNEALPPIVPRATFAELWPTEKNTLDLFHGFHEPSPIEIARNESAATVVYPLTAKHRYSISDNQWTPTSVKSAELEMAKLGKDDDGALLKFATRMSVWIPGISRGYALGGETYWDSPKKSWKNIRHVGDHNGLLVYDLKTDSWKNVTMPMKSIRMGVLVHLRTEDDDILITFGGMTDEANGSTRRLVCLLKSGWMLV